MTEIERGDAENGRRGGENLLGRRRVTGITLNRPAPPPVS